MAAARLEGWPELVAPTPAELSAWLERLASTGVAAAVVDPAGVPVAREHLGRARIPVVALISAPLGAMTTRARLAQAERALAEGADELAVAMDLSAVRSGELGRAAADLGALRRLAGATPMRVIYHAARLGPDLGPKAASAALGAGADALMTNSHFDGAVTAEQVEAARRLLGPGVTLVASGGVQAAAHAAQLLAAGASRVAMAGVRPTPGRPS